MTIRQPELQGIKMYEQTEKAYHEFLEIKGLDDSSVIRVGFFTIVLCVMESDPILNKETQTNIITNLAEETMSNVWDNEELVKKLLKNHSEL